MFFKLKLGVFFLLLAGILAASISFSCRSRISSSNEIKNNAEMPPVILWAWERDEDLRFLDASRFGVAFHAQTLFLEADQVVFRPRRQPLQISPETYLIAVTRIETSKEKSARPTLSARQKSQAVALIKRATELPNVKAVQIDYDAAVSERDFYRALMTELRRALPENYPLTMTALASWCIESSGDGGGWLGEMPADEAVPMAFRMGADDQSIRDFLARGNDWREPLCRGSYGVALDEPLRRVNFRPARRFYVFKSESGAWRPEDLRRLPIEEITR